MNAGKWRKVNVRVSGEEQSADGLSAGANSGAFEPISCRRAATNNAVLSNRVDRPSTSPAYFFCNPIDQKKMMLNSKIKIKIDQIT